MKGENITFLIKFDILTAFNASWLVIYIYRMFENDIALFKWRKKQTFPLCFTDWVPLKAKPRIASGAHTRWK